MNSKVRTIVGYVAKRHGVSPEAVTARGRRDLAAVKARYEAMWLLRHSLRKRAVDPNAYSLNAIGMALGGFHHSTVIHGLRQHQRRMNEGYESRRGENFRDGSDRYVRPRDILAGRVLEAAE
jgi:chromosomal replication initiation ATPase DnaA